MLGQTGHTPVVVGHLKGDGDRLGLERFGHVAILLPDIKRRVGMTVDRRLHHSLPSLFRVDARSTFQHRVDHHGDGVVANHAVVVLPPEMPYREVAVSIVMTQHAVDKVGVAPGENQRIQGMGRPVGVPQREGSVLGLTLRQLPDRVDRGHVLAVDVRECVGLEHRVVQRRVEDFHLLRLTLHLDASQLLVPGFVGLGADGVEALPRGLDTQVLKGVFSGDRRQPHLHLHLARRSVELQESLEVAAIDHRRACAHGASVGKHSLNDRLGEFHGEIHLAQFGPAGNHAISGHHRRRHHPYLGVDNLAVPAPFLRRTLQVDQNVGLGPVGECVTVDSSTRRRRHLGADSLVVEHHRVIARRGGLVVVGEGRRCRRPRSGGEYRDVNQVRRPGAAQARVGESVYSRVIVVIARGIEPVRRRMGVRAELHHTEGHRRPGMVVARQSPVDTASADEGVDISGEFTGVGLRHSQEGGRQDGRHAKQSVHFHMQSR